MAKNTLLVYNLSEFGVDVDSDNLHVPTGALRQAQNIHRDPTATQAGSIVTRKGMVKLNASALGSGSILGGIAIPAFEVGDGTATLLLGFGD